MNLNKVAEESLKNSICKGFNWSKDYLLNTLTRNLLLIHSEISEVTEFLRKYKKDSELLKESDIRYEFADIILRTVEICAFLNIDIEQAIVNKLEYNKKRIYMNGNKNF